MEKRIIRISVRNLVEFVLRSGDLDRRRSSQADKEAMQKGSRIHRKIQRQMGGEYQAEVPLVWEQEYDEFVLRLEGRADGIIAEGKKAVSGESIPVIDEIKGVFLDVNYIQEPREVHLAQAKCYACIYAQINQCQEIAVQMTYCNMETEQIRRFHSEYAADELKQWFQGILAYYQKWAEYQVQWLNRRNRSMEGLEFPFPYRPGQRDIVKGVYHSIAVRKQLFVQAPTGVGKTMSAVFPAVRAMGEGRGEKIFYLTAKNVARVVAEEAVSLLRQRGLLFQAVVLTAREKICPMEKAMCNPDECPYAKGHFDRVNEAVFELWTHEGALDKKAIENQAQRWQVCPYEMSLDLALWVDTIICDYNYVFDPNAHLRRFFGENSKGDYIFLIDEAHNLVDRGRAMYSAQLDRKRVLTARRKFRSLSRKLGRHLSALNRQLLALEKECETYRVLENAGNVPVLVMNITGELEALMENDDVELTREEREELLDFYFIMRDFLNISELVDENYVVYTQGDEEGVRIKLFCVNPSRNLQNYLDKGASTVFFSATFHPMSYYHSLFSRRQDDYAVYVQSPFDQENRCLCIGRDVSSRYTRRGQEEYRKISGYIYRAVSARIGNYLVFFPSYQMQQEVLQEFLEQYGSQSVRCICQRSGMDEGEREEFLDMFLQGNQKESLVGFCVMGGVFSEGIDLIGDSLIGVVVVGTGIPQISCEREILKAYYDERGGKGFDYAYRYPGMNKVLQAAGRVIRTAQDRGVILLLDERFLQWEYRRLFPAEWSDYQVCVQDTLEQHLKNFWSR